MTTIVRTFVFVGIAFCCGRVAMGQTLAPRAYVITPTGANAVTLSWSFFDGGLNFNGTVPITGATGVYHIPVVSYYHSFSLFGRSANITGLLPYGVGTFSGSVLGAHQEIYRSGLLDLSLRLSVNLKGGPAMSAQEFANWKQKTLLGVSLIVVAPTGQYNPRHLVNWGIHRWAFKPEIGLSRRWGKWMLDAYGAGWFFTPNDDFFSSLPGSTGPNRQTQEPIGAVELHLSYDVKPRLWVSADGNYWYGGKTSLNGVESPTTLQANSRLGATAAIPITKNQSLKFSYSRGTYVTFGGNFQNVSAAWQYSWHGRPN